MAVAGGTQALIATFAFGLVALASSSAACLFTFGSRQLRGNAPVSNGMRLVLLTFLLSSTFWSIMDFVATLINGDGNSSCQVLVAFASGFDQIARVAFEQFLLWRIKPKKTSSGIFVLQALIPVRFIVGGVFVAVQRPQVYPVCIAKNILLPLGIATLVTDALIVCILFALIFVIKPSTQSPSLQSSSLEPAKIFAFLTAGFGAWLATSIPMILGIETLPVASRTVVPSIGLLVLIGLAVLFRSHLLIIESDSPLPSARPNTSKALPNRPIKKRDTSVSPEVFDRPWDGPQSHFAQAKRPAAASLIMPWSSSRGAERALPIIDRPTPGQTKRGVGGVPVKGQLFPPIRANTAPIVLRTPPKKRSKGKLSISNPIIRESSALKIRDKIPTTDLAMAAKNDQERRAMSSRAVALNRSSQYQALTRNSSDIKVKRKEVASASYVPPISVERSRLATDAVTTATQVSPGAEDLRRRSPRPTLGAPEMAISPPVRSPKRPIVSTEQVSNEGPPAIPPQSPLRRNRPGKSVLRDTSSIFMDSSTPPAIPTPLRQENSSWPSASDVSPLVPRVKPLPMPFPNPRSDAAPSKTYESAAAATARASVLTRNGPGSVRKDIRPSRQRPDSADRKEPAPAKTPVQLRAVIGIPLNPRAQPAKDLSGKNGERGKTIMFPNKSDTYRVGEPVSRQIFALSLASSSLSTDSIVHRPRPIPRKSSIYKADFTIKVSPTVYQHRLSRSGGSVELQRESMDSESETISRIPSFPEPPKSAGAVLVLGNYQRKSDNASKAVTPGNIDESFTGNSRVSVSADSAPSNIAGTDPKTTLSESTAFGSRSSTESESAYNIRRQSSPVLPAEDLRHISMADTVPRYSDDNPLVSVPNSARSGTSSASQQDDDGKEIVPLVLDTESEDLFSAHSSQRNSLTQPISWHRRVGDACPTFSDRKNSGKSPKRVLAPAPLLLGRASKPTRIVETPPPLESPQHALDIIQQQLRQLDESDSETGVEDKQRRRLLENLEAEMGAQETHWQDMRRNLTNRSPSSTRSSMSLVPSGDLHLTSPRPSPAPRSPDLGQAVMGKGADHASALENHTTTPADEKSEPPPNELTGTRGRSESDFTDDGSAQAVAGGVENRAKFGKSASRNKDGLLAAAITNDISAHRQLASRPTPAETAESAEEVEKDEEFDAASAKKNNFSAWTQLGSVNLAAVEKAPPPVSHWSIDSDTTTRASESLLRPQIFTRDFGSPGEISPLTREAEETPPPNRIYNKAVVSPISPPTWLLQESQVSPAVSEQRQSPRRPVTQKPPRRSKRITLLPDIPESPKPLSNKHDTLGVFQFPWGETSDIPTLQPQRSSIYSVPLPGATLNEFPLAQPFLPSQGPVYPSQVYPASFFYHYSDDADSDGSTGGYSDDEDEAFDETTLWEIANLLRTSAVPSRESLFPSSPDYRPPSRAGFISAHEATILPVRHLPTADLEDSTLGNKDKELPPLPLSNHAVWKSDTMYATTTRSAGLAQPDEKLWMHYLGKQAETLRAAPRKSELASITSTSLWSPTPKKVEIIGEPLAQGLWQSSKEASVTPSSSAPSTPFLASPSSFAESSISEMSVLAKATTESHGLWTPPVSVACVFFGLPQDDEEWGRYTAKKAETSRPKPRPSAQDVIHSTRLWASPKPAIVAAAAHAARPVPASQPLWSKPAALPAEQTEGLWSISHIRRRYKTTAARPAALDTARKLRIDTRPLAPLRSASLWSTTTQMPPRQVPDWLALSTTMRPVSPEGASTLSDQDDTSAFDTYSLRSEVTVASSVATSKQSSHRKTASKQAAQEELDAAFRDVMQTKPIVPEAVLEEEQEREQEEPKEAEKLFFDVSRLHPVFAVDVLHVTSENAHPAATGYLHSVINGAPKPRCR